MVCAKLKKEFQNQLSFHFPIEVIHSRAQSSRSGHVRDEKYIAELKKSFSWIGFPLKEPDILIIIDDVITTGAQFRAYKEFLLENIQKKPERIIGLFWAKAIKLETIGAIDDIE